MRYLLLLLLACCGFAADEVPLGLGPVGLGSAPSVVAQAPPLGDTQIGLGTAPPTIAQIITAANFTDLNAIATETRTSGAYDPYNNAVRYVNQRRQRPITLNGVTHQADLVELARTNLIAAGTTEVFTLVWTGGTGVPTITADAGTAPDAEVTADSFVEGTTNGEQSLRQNVTKAASSLSYYGAFYIKNLSGSREVVVELDDGTTTNGVSMRIDPATGTVTSAPAAFGTGWTLNTTAIASAYTIESAGNSWYHVALLVNSDATTTIRTRLALWNGSTTSYAGNGTSGVLVWGADLCNASVPGSFVSRRSILGQTETLNNGFTKTRTTVTSDTVANPLTSDITADKLVEDSTASNTHYIGALLNTKPTSSVTVTLSAYGHSVERSWIYLECATAANTRVNGAGAYFDLTNGATGSNLTFGSGWAVSSKAITSLGSGWYRCSVTITTDTSANVAEHVGLATADATPTYTGDGASGASIYGIQLEYGPTATTYWAQTTTGVRQVDVLSAPCALGVTTGTLTANCIPYGWTGQQGGSAAFRVLEADDTFLSGINRSNSLSTFSKRGDSVSNNNTFGNHGLTNQTLAVISDRWNAFGVTQFIAGGVKGAPASTPTLPFSATTTMFIGCATSSTLQFQGWVNAIFTSADMSNNDEAALAAATVAP